MAETNGGAMNTGPGCRLRRMLGGGLIGCEHEPSGEHVTTIGQQFGAGGAALAAGIINAVAGGGTLVSFPTLVAIGVPSVHANITNTVSLCPGYLGGAYAQRKDLAENADRLRSLALVAAIGGLTGSLLLVLSPEKLFRNLVPYLILGACAIFAAQPWLKTLRHREDLPPNRLALGAAIFGCAVYGGYFGAGLGIMLLATLGLALPDPLKRLNALKQALSLVINILAALFFVFSGKVEWQFVPVMAVASLIGGNVGGRLVGKLKPIVLRVLVIGFGVAAAVKFFL